MGLALSRLDRSKTPDWYTGLLSYFLLPFQLRFLADRCRFTAWESSRQIGKSFTLGWKALLRGASQPKRHQTVIAASERQALELLDKVMMHIELLQRMTSFQFLKGEPSKTQLTLVNGSRIRAIPANPRTARGLTGDLYLDEFAHVQHDRDMWAAVLPVISRANFCVTMASTPLGDEGVWYECTHPAPDARYRFSIHRTTVHDALADGLKMDVGFIRSQMDEDTWLQEYECAYLSVHSSMFPWALLRKCLQNEDPSVEHLLAGGSCPTFLGVDIGRKRDVTAIVRAREFPEGQLNVVDPHVLARTPFGTQRAYIARIIRNENVKRCLVDATGIGAQLAEELEAAFPGIVEPVTMHLAVKHDIVTRAKAGLEKGAVKLCDDGALLADWHKIKRHVTHAGNITFDAPRDKTGHADRFWASALALSAAHQQGGWDFGYLGQKDAADAEDEHQWFQVFEDVREATGLLDRAVRPEEIGFTVFDDDDLEDMREAVVGERRPAVTRAKGEAKPLALPQPEGCVLPFGVADELKSRGEDPCWGCDVDRRLCGGRPANPAWKPERPGEEALVERVQVCPKDTLLDMVVSQGHVPPPCTLDGATAWSLVCEGVDPCRGCNADRRVCGGRPAAREVTHGPVG